MNFNSKIYQHFTLITAALLMTSIVSAQSMNIESSSLNPEEIKPGEATTHEININASNFGGSEDLNVIIVSFTELEEENILNQEISLEGSLQEIQTTHNAASTAFLTRSNSETPINNNIEIIKEIEYPGDFETGNVEISLTHSDTGSDNEMHRITSENYEPVEEETEEQENGTNETQQTTNNQETSEEEQNLSETEPETVNTTTEDLEENTENNETQNGNEEQTQDENQEGSSGIIGSIIGFFTGLF